MSINQANNWTFLSNHSHVLLCLVENEAMRMRDIAIKVGITERAVQGIIADLSEAGYISICKKGRCNTYKINSEKQLRHPIEAKRNIQDLIQLIYTEKNSQQKT